MEAKPRQIKDLSSSEQSPEPLKDKLVIVLDDDAGFFIPKDVLSAVEWLKEHFKDADLSSFDNEFIINVINEAFEDVVRE